MAAKVIKVVLNTDVDDGGCGEFKVETTGFQGKGCDAIHQMFAGIGTAISNIKKPEYKQLTQGVVRGNS